MFKDLYDEDISVGDTVIVAFNDKLRLGVVLETRQGYRSLLEVKLLWDYGKVSAWVNAYPSRRFFKLGRDHE